MTKKIQKYKVFVVQMYYFIDVDMIFRHHSMRQFESSFTETRTILTSDVKTMRVSSYIPDSRSWSVMFPIASSNADTMPETYYVNEKVKPLLFLLNHCVTCRMKDQR